MTGERNTTADATGKMLTPMDTLRLDKTAFAVVSLHES